MIKTIEQNTLGHFQYLPNLLGIQSKQLGAFDIINCGLNTSMFNIAYGGFLSNSDINRQIKELVAAFDGQAFALWCPPSKYQTNTKDALLSNDFICEALEVAMAMPIKDFVIPKVLELDIQEVKNTSQLNKFVSVLAGYDTQAKLFYDKLSLSQLQQKERLYIGMRGEDLVSIGLLYIENKNAGLFSLIVDESLRGQGLGKQSMYGLFHEAKRLNCETMSLSASTKQAVSLYEKLGFKRYGQFECYEYNPS